MGGYFKRVIRPGLSEEGTSELRLADGSHLNAGQGEDVHRPLRTSSGCLRSRQKGQCGQNIGNEREW